jgi:hypothetical protein
VRRAAKAVAVSLAIGFAISIGVAWACALYSPTLSANRWLVEGWPTSRAEREQRQAFVDMLAQSSFKFRKVLQEHRVGIGCAIVRTTTYEDLWQGPAHEHVAMSAGWPWRCLTTSAEIVQGNADVTWIGPIWQTGVQPPDSLGSKPYGFHWGLGPKMDAKRRIPIRPNWLVFANAVFWGAIAWNLCFLGCSARRALRAKRGCCRGCGYEIGAPFVCPECGLGSGRHGL